jgi:hypothetical protein
MARYTLTSKMGYINKNGQMWFMDFIIGIIIFSLTLVTYYTYTINLSNQDTVVMDDLISDSKSVTASLMSSGFPQDWDSNNVIRVGITGNNNKINNTRFSEFVQIDYNTTKKLFGTIYDYFLYFTNESGDVQNIEGFCGTGKGEVNITFDIRSAYFYEKPGEEEFLKSFMENEFSADVYCKKDQDCPGASLDDFISAVNNYDFIVVEHPVFSSSEFNDFENAVDPWVLEGNVFFAGGEMPSTNKRKAFGVEFNKISGQSESDKLATVVNTDEIVAFNLADNIIFRQAYYIEDENVGSDLKDIARFNGTDVEFEDIKANGDIALAKWPYGTGKILFFSDFDATYLAGNIQEILENSAKKLANAKCLPIDISYLERNNLVKVERLLTYNNDITKMILYLWN